MNKIEKIKVLKKAINMVEGLDKDRYSGGLCFVLGKTIYGRDSLLNYDFEVDAENFGIKRPRSVPLTRSYWWSLNAAGDAKRIAVLKRAIKRLSK